MNNSVDFCEEDFFWDDPNLLNPDNLSGMQSIEDLKSDRTTWVDSLDKILLKETGRLVREKVDKIKDPTTRSIVKLTHWIPLWQEDTLFNGLKLSSDNEISCSGISDIIRESAVKDGMKIHTKKQGTYNKIKGIQNRWLQILGRDTYKNTQGSKSKENWRPHAKWEIEIWPNWISNEDFEKYLSIKSKFN